MRPGDYELAHKVEAGLLSYSSETRPLPGILDPIRREVLVEQLLESVHRVRYVSVIRARPLSDRRANPDDELFDPLRAAIINQRQGNLDEAFWLVFLFVHFGKHAHAGWRYAREVYGRMGEKLRWDWARISVDPAGFREWLAAHQGQLKREGMPRGFGNHRKYESLNALSSRGTGAAVETYVKWVGPTRSHRGLIERACERVDGEPRRAFDELYRSMRVIATFGRTARFDYLSMLGKLQLAPIEPGSAYLRSATGPAVGARLLFGSNGENGPSLSDLDTWLIELDTQLQLGMQVLEDALCNWQKSPDKFKAFRG